MSERPLCSISLDVDDLWSYMKIRGDQRWVERPSYLPRFLPVALDTLEALDMRITFFIVNSAQIESGTLNLNETVGLANRQAAALAPLLNSSEAEAAHV